jgi:hypothetical protein
MGCTGGPESLVQSLPLASKAHLSHENWDLTLGSSFEVPEPGAIGEWRAEGRAQLGHAFGAWQLCAVTQMLTRNATVSPLKPLFKWLT